MKVLHIISGDLWAGAEVQAFTQLVALQKLGIEVAVAIMNEGELARRLRERGIPTTVFPENTMSALAILNGLRALIRQHHPDIVHTHRLKENILGAIAARLAGGVPSIRTVHGSPEHVPRGLRQAHKQLIDALNRWVGKHLQQKIIAVSTELGEKLTAEIPLSKIAVIENGVDVDAARAQVRPIEFRVAALNTVHIGIIGRLVPVKRVDLFLQTAALLRAQMSDRQWQFHIFGDGPLRSTLEAHASALQIDDITSFHGHRNDIIACIAGLDVLIMCSDHEGLPMTALESLAVGTPILAHAVGGLNDILANNAGGILVQENTPQSYAENLFQLLQEDRADLRKKGLARLNSLYTSTQNVEKVLALYNQLVKLK